MIKAVWNFRGFVLESVKREFQIKYKNSLLGSMWAVINPLAMILVYTVIFSEIMKAKLPGVSGQFSYSIYLCSGIFMWGLFSEIVARSQAMFVENSNLLKKVSFPRVCLPIIILFTAFINFVIVYTIFSVFLLLTNSFPGATFLALIPLTFILAAFSVGLGMILGVFNVFFRDVSQFMGVFLTFWFWLTPIVYPITILNDSLKSFLYWNPLYPIVTAYQGVLVQAEWPNWTSLLPLIVVTIITNWLGLNLFRKHAGDIVDEL